jgi:hypothetical protein
MTSLSTIKIIRVALSVSVALWMAGAGCMLGCDNMVAASAHEANSAASSTISNSLTIVAAGDACASMHSHDCCARRTIKTASSTAKPASKIASNPRTSASVFHSQVVPGFAATSSMMMDCPLAVNAAAALSKARPDQSNSALPVTRANAALPRLQERATALSPKPCLPNRGHTYLRYCVFLI